MVCSQGVLSFCATKRTRYNMLTCRRFITFLECRASDEVSDVRGIVRLKQDSFLQSGRSRAATLKIASVVASKTRRKKRSGRMFINHQAASCPIDAEPLFESARNASRFAHCFLLSGRSFERFIFRPNW